MPLSYMKNCSSSGRHCSTGWSPSNFSGPASAVVNPDIGTARNHWDIGSFSPGGFLGLWVEIGSRRSLVDWVGDDFNLSLDNFDVPLHDRFNVRPAGAVVDPDRGGAGNDRSLLSLDLSLLQVFWRRCSSIRVGQGTAKAEQRIPGVGR